MPEEGSPDLLLQQGVERELRQSTSQSQRQQESRNLADEAMGCAPVALALIRSDCAVAWANEKARQVLELPAFSGDLWRRQILKELAQGRDRRPVLTRFPLASGSFACVIATPTRIEELALFSIVLPEWDSDVLEESIRCAFNLTSSEARLALGLTCTGQMNDAASRLGISLHTARSYLKSVYSKMGVSRQIELARLICCFACFVAPGSMPLLP